MRKRKGQSFIAWMITVMVFFGAFSPVNVAQAATPATLDAAVTITVGEEGNVIDGSASVEMAVTFPVPVKGDGVEDYFQHGDEVTLLLSTSFMFDPVPSGSFPLMYGAKRLGKVTLSNNSHEPAQAIATIVFDGDEDIFDPDKITGEEPPYANVQGRFEASLKYNGSHEVDGEGNKIVTILEKTYKLKLPADVTTYTLIKSVEDGAIDLDNGLITWTVFAPPPIWGDCPLIWRAACSRTI